MAILCQPGATAFFVVYPSSTSLNLECAFPQDSTSAVEWLDTSSSSPITFEHVAPYAPTMDNNTAIVRLVLTDDMHEHVLTCKGVDHSGHAQYKQYLVIIEGEHNYSCMHCG